VSENTDVLIERRGPALWITINRPARRNALTDNVLLGIARGYESAETDSNVRVIVLTGSGDKAFCAGADLKPGCNFAFDHARPTTSYADLARRARSARVPSIARVNGACLAGGMGLLGMTDLAIAASSAVFGLPEVRVGLFPMQACALLQDLVPRRVLREWSLCGERFDAATAQRAGLVNAVVGSEELDAAVKNHVDQITAGSPVAIRRGLWALRRMEDSGFDDALAFGEAQIGLAALTEDAREGIAAFNEKRRPRWAVE
jgi:enoyl-CoA hydratase/carnithine racemase